MLHLISPCTLPLRLISAGNLINNRGFIHRKRNLDTFVLILGDLGTLYIKQGDKEFEISSNQYLLLFPGMQHMGYKASQGHLSYYWCHFMIQQDSYRLVTQEELGHQRHFSNNIISNDHYIIPETGDLHHSKREVLLYRQLLDAYRRSSYSEYLAHYALSLLAMEITADFISGYAMGLESSTYKHITEIMEWIRVNHIENLSVTKVAEAFNYNPNYLSGAFKKHTGVSLLDYITRTKVDYAKSLLLSSRDTVKNIANCVGFEDEKYFMKVFKKIEGVTPSQYRNAF